MRKIATICFISWFGFLHAQNDTLVFKQVSYSFMPVITSPYLYFTSDGIMWFSTENGITSFDGSERVHHSNAKEASALGLNAITCMAEDSLHNLYIAGHSHLIYYNRKIGKINVIYDKTGNNGAAGNIDIACIYINSNGLVYAGTTGKGLFIYDTVAKTLRHINIDVKTNGDHYNVATNTIKCFATDPLDSSKLWLGTFNGIYVFDKETKKLFRNFKVINPGINKAISTPVLYDIRKMYVADDSTLWFSTFASGIGKYNTRTGIAKLYMQDVRIKEKKFWKAPSIRGFAQWKNGKYVLGISDPAPAVFDTRSGKFENFYIGNENNNYVNLQYVTNDTKNNVWLISKGLLYVSVPGYYFLQNTDIKKQLTTDYLANQLGDIIFDEQHKIYYAASPFSSGVYVLDTNINVKKIIPVPLYTNSYTYKETGNEFITKDSSGRIWTTCLGTYILLPGNNEFLYADKIYPSLAWLKTRGETVGITTTRDGDILMLFGDGAIFHINQKTLEADSITLPENNISQPFSITTKHTNYDPARNKTYVNNAIEIAQYDLTGKSKKIIPPDVLFGTVDWKGQKIQYALDHQGRIWIWLQRYGVRIIDPDKLVCIDSIPSGTKGLISNNNVFIRNGGDSCMLFIGQEGLVIYNYYRQQSLFIDDNNGWEHQYDYCKKYCNGKIFVSASNSIQYFDMQHFSKIIPPLKLSLNYVTANDSLVFTNNYLNEPIQIFLQHDQNNITLSFSAAEFFFPERIEYAYRLTGVNNTWQYTNYFNRRVSFSALRPGKYLFLLKAQFKGGNWSMPPIEYSITIMPAWWQTDLFKLISIIAAAFIVFLLLRWRINTLLKQEQFRAIQLREKSEIEKEILELEAKALRVQMNPHFIFNCMNSIKSLIQKNEQEKAIAYLTTFSKLTRTVFQNSDKKEISLYDEIETCRLYTQLESMRFSNKLNYTFDIAEQTDFKSIMVPPLILQPFIENAIWHGLMPKAEGGMLYVRVTEKRSKIYCIVEDDGIGRSISMQNKFIDTTTYHQSKGMQLTQSRLELNNTLNQRNATVEIIDKTNDIGEPSGTRVILIFNEE